MTQRSKIHELLSRETAGEEVLIQGWVRTKRSSKTVSFLQVNDGSTLGDLQIVVDQDLPDHCADRLSEHRLQHKRRGHSGGIAR